jgi:hypothetical protein
MYHNSESSFSSVFLPRFENCELVLIYLAGGSVNFQHFLVNCMQRRPPLGLFSLKSYLEKQSEIKCSVLDLTSFNHPADFLTDYFNQKSQSPYVIGFYVTSMNLPSVVQNVKSIKNHRKWEKRLVLAGGPGAMPH